MPSPGAVWPLRLAGLAEAALPGIVEVRDEENFAAAAAWSVRAEAFGAGKRGQFGRRGRGIGGTPRRGSCHDRKRHEERRLMARAKLHSRKET